eukprot:150295_1
MSTYKKDISKQALISGDYDENEKDKSLGYDARSMDTRNHSLLRSTANTPSPAQQQQPQFCGDYVDPLTIIKIGIEIGLKKAKSTVTLISSLRILLKAMMSGSYLGFSISLTVYALSLDWDPISAAILFAMGFVMLILMGNDLATGNFALLPMAYIHYKGQKDKKNNVSIKMILINWTVVYCGNFIGALLYVFILWGGQTHFGQINISYYEGFKDSLCTVTENKTLIYKETGGAGWFASFFNGIACNWMVTMAVLLSFSSKSTLGKIIAMYIPITIFICLGFEHSIVNLFLLPAGLTYKCDTYNFGEWWIWNQIPVTLGNIIGGMCFTGFIYMAIWQHKL